MNFVLCVDPGIRIAGAALFRDRALVATSVVRGTKTGNRATECAQMAREIVSWYNTVWWQLNTPRPLMSQVPVPQEFLSEWPQIYTRDKSKGDPNDLLPLAGVCSAVAALLTDTVCVSYHPKDWKGTVDGDAMMKRVLERLEPGELTVSAGSLLRLKPKTADQSILELCRSTTAHHAVDAIGIGLHHFGRLTRRRFFAR